MFKKDDIVNFEYIKSPLIGLIFWLYNYFGGELTLPKFFIYKKIDIIHISFYNLIDENQTEKRYLLCPITIISVICLNL